MQAKHDKTFDPHHIFKFEFENEFKNIRALRENAALVLHHDAITGTSRQTVVRDYLQRLTKSQADVKKMNVRLVQGLLLKKDVAVIPKGGIPSITSNEYKLRMVKGAEAEKTESDPAAEGHATPFDVKGKRGYPIIIQNPLGWQRQDVAKVLLAEDTNVHHAKGIVVLDDKGMPVPAQVNAELVGDRAVENPFPLTSCMSSISKSTCRLGCVPTTCAKQRGSSVGEQWHVLARFVPIDMYVVRRMSGTLENKPKGRLRGGWTITTARMTRPSIDPRAFQVKLLSKMITFA